MNCAVAIFVSDLGFSRKGELFLDIKKLMDVEYADSEVAVKCR